METDNDRQMLTSRGCTAELQSRGQWETQKETDKQVNLWVKTWCGVALMSMRWTSMTAALRLWIYSQNWLCLNQSKLFCGQCLSATVCACSLWNNGLMKWLQKFKRTKSEVKTMKIQYICESSMMQNWRWWSELLPGNRPAQTVLQETVVHFFCSSTSFKRFFFFKCTKYTQYTITMTLWLPHFQK